MSVDHGIAADSKGKGASIFRGVDRARIEGNVAFNRLLRESCHARRDLPVNRYIGDTHLLHWCDERPGLARVAIQKAFPFERVDVLHHRCLTGEAEMMLDLTCAWRHAFFTLLQLD